MTNADWIKLNLPPVAAFSKNGVTLTVDAAVTGALADNADNKYLALADLLDMLAANVQYKSETLDDYKYDQPTILDAAAKWRNKGGTIGVPTGISVVGDLPQCVKDVGPATW